MKEHNVDLYSSIIMLIAAGIFWSQMGNFTKFGAIFPKAIIALLAIAAVGLMVKAFVNPHKKTIFKHAEGKASLVFLIVMILWVVLISIVGFVVTSILAYFFITWYLDKDKQERKFKDLALTFVVISVQVLFFYTVFAKVLNVPVPHGFLF